MTQPPPHWRPQQPPPPPQGWHQHPPQQPPGGPPWQGAPQRWQQGPPIPQTAAGAGLWTHLRRAVDWNVAQVTVAPRERQALEIAGIFDRLQGLFVWRRSSLLVALPVLLLSAILSFSSAADTNTTNLSGLGVLVNWLPSVALLFVPLGCAVVLMRWTELRRSSRLLLTCWMISIVVPMVVALVPLDLIIDQDLLAQARANDMTGEVGAQLQAGRIALAISYATALLPVVLSVPGGMLKGASRVKSLFPSSALPGWFLVAIAPFYSMFTIVVFVLVDQLAGNALLVIGVGLLAFSPWLFVIYRKVYARPLSLAEAKGELARASRLGGFVTWGAVFFIVVYLFTGTVDNRDVLGSGSPDSVFAYLDVARTVVEVLARGIVAAVVFSTIFLSMIFSEWQAATGMREDIRREHNHEMRGLERYVTDPRNGYGDVRLSGAPVPQHPPR